MKPFQMRTMIAHMPLLGTVQLATRIFLVMVVLLGSVNLRGAERRAEKDRPNVLFLAVDDMNDWIGCLESVPQAITPNLNRLAKRGVNFTNAHTAGVFCAPSRAAIFSGQYASTKNEKKSSKNVVFYTKKCFLSIF